MADKCPQCKSPLYCESCETHPTHRPYAKQAIRALIQAVAKTCNDETIKEISKEEISFGSPSTYVHWTKSAIAHVSTIVPNGEDGELDLHSLNGLKVTMATDDPPQSGRSSIIVMTHAQHELLELLTRKQGDHQELCKRVYKRVKMHEEKRVTLVLSTDMARIQGALKCGETGDWQDLFREVLSANPSGSMPTSEPAAGASAGAK